MDIVRLMINEKGTIFTLAPKLPDDVLIGYFMLKKNIPITSANQKYFIYRKDWLAQKNSLPKDAYHFRVRNYDLMKNPGWVRDIACPYDEELFIAADIVKTIYPTASLNPNYQSTYPLEIPLSTLYHYYSAFPSDINEHLSVLRELARSVNKITEIGVNNMCATWALLQGLSEQKQPASYTGYFSSLPPPQDLLLAKKLATENAISFSFKRGDELLIEIESTDLLFIDSIHTFVHLTYELEKFSPHVKKYIVMHDTSAPWGEQNDRAYQGNYSEYPIEIDRSKKGLWAAIEDFLLKHPEWTLKERLLNNHGLTLLQRKE